MDPILSRFRDVYRRNPKLLVAFFVLSAAIGIFIGYRLIGPELFG